MDVGGAGLEAEAQEFIDREAGGQPVAVHCHAGYRRGAGWGIMERAGRPRQLAGDRITGGGESVRGGGGRRRRRLRRLGGGNPATPGASWASPSLMIDCSCRKASACKCGIASRPATAA